MLISQQVTIPPTTRIAAVGRPLVRRASRCALPGGLLCLRAITRRVDFVKEGWPPTQRLVAHPQSDTQADTHRLARLGPEAHTPRHATLLNIVAELPVACAVTSGSVARQVQAQLAPLPKRQLLLNRSAHGVRRLCRRGLAVHVIARIPLGELPRRGGPRRIRVVRRWRARRRWFLATTLRPGASRHDCRASAPPPASDPGRCARLVAETRLHPPSLSC
jgi:hypothetical protein